MKNTLLIALAIAVTSCTAQRMTMSTVTEKNGKIGIGTTEPDELLTVKGKIHTQEVIVDLKGAVAPDYVFEHYYEGSSQLNADYRLLSLTELEKYIKQHQHLPKIPSAEEIDTEGLALKEMNLLLLEKIEELTLYTLEQQKEIEELKKKVERISKKQP
ncbi:MAG: hypothetical protein KTR22_04930 [Flavobacteriaceae bacterium]|nr:hypothetical protein [Flavobacteriaceae bacterium]